MSTRTTAICDLCGASEPEAFPDGWGRLTLQLQPGSFRYGIAGEYWKTSLDLCVRCLSGQLVEVANERGFARLRVVATLTPAPEGDA